MKWTILILLGQLFFDSLALGSSPKIQKKMTPRGGPDSTVRFSYDGPQGLQLSLASPLSDWKEGVHRMRETQPGHYEVSFTRPWLHEIPYKFVLQTGKTSTWFADPKNAENLDKDGNSLRWVNFQEDPLLFQKPKSELWKIHRFQARGKNIKERIITVLHPPGKNSTPTTTLYLQDGLDYLNYTFIRNWVTAISEKPGFPSLTLVLIPPVDRMVEYKMNDDYVAFLTDVVIPEVESRFYTGENRRRRAVMGASLGGLISLYAALKHPNMFGFVGSQSGAFWYNNVEFLKHIQPAQIRPKVYMSMGTFESQRLQMGHRKVANALVKYHYDVESYEDPSTHDWIAWRQRLSDFAKFLQRESE